jgi:hypothetical protein
VPPQVSQWFELVVFTASMEIYGTAVADKLDGNQGMLNRRYYRQHCTLDFGSYTKVGTRGRIGTKLTRGSPGPVGDLCRSLLGLHSGQLTGGLQGVSR